MRFRTVSFAVMLAFGGRLLAQSPPSPNTWGLATGYTMILHHEFHGANPEDYFLQNGASQGSWCEGSATGECLGYAQILAPEGALLGALDVWGYDASTDSDMHYALIASCDGPGGQTETFLDDGDLPGSAGAFHFSSTFAGVTVNNAECGYAIRFKFTDPGDPPVGSLIRLRKVRLSWIRQVSPAPLSASFADVPTDHPFFQFVEALVRSGITVGCGLDSYCPDEPLTRGQMAVFLAKALGLQWPVPLSE